MRAFPSFLFLGSSPWHGFTDTLPSFSFKLRRCYRHFPLWVLELATLPATLLASRLELATLLALPILSASPFWGVPNFKLRRLLSPPAYILCGLDLAQR